MVVLIIFYPTSVSLVLNIWYWYQPIFSYWIEWTALINYHNLPVWIHLSLSEDKSHILGYFCLKFIASVLYSVRHHSNVSTSIFPGLSSEFFLGNLPFIFPKIWLPKQSFSCLKQLGNCWFRALNLNKKWQH